MVSVVGVDGSDGSRVALEVVLLGSVASYLAQHSDRPVAIVPAADRDQADPSTKGER